MKSFMSDTPPHLQEMVIEGYRRMTPAEKLHRVSELNRAVQELALARIKKQYGNISQGEQKLRLAALWLDKDTMIRVFNWDSDREGY